MRNFITVIFLTGLTCLASPSSLFAQGLGYAVAGPATTMGFVTHSRTTVNVAAGGEVVAADRVGIGGEFGLFNRLIVGSANATVHLAGVSQSKVSPFVTGGYSRMGIGDGEGAFSAFNVGAGLHVWTGDRVGLRFELRDHLRPDDRGTTQYWSLRAGIAFR
jgi:hypothetical protein